jgi:hypothetical protein
VTKNVAILGCGPAGLMVAHAAAMSGWNFRIYSQKRKSKLFGAQYLHENIPGLEHGGPMTVKYQLDGTPEQYRRKVYGEEWDGTVSPEDYIEEHYAWDLRAAYEHLWFVYGAEIIDVDLSGAWPVGLNKRAFPVWTNQADLVISTIPRTVWDNNPDNFKSTTVWAMGDGDYERVHLHRPPPFHVVCDGTKKHHWYRVSNIFGYCTMEWPQWWNQPFASVTPPAHGAVRVAKPLAYTGNAAQDFIHLGRFAQWEKGVLTTDVFRESLKIFAKDSVEVANDAI